MISQRFINGMHTRSKDAHTSKGTILYIHGLGESGLCVEEIMEHPFLKDFSHLAVDLPGYGKSPWPQAPLSISRYADLPAEWLSARDALQLIIVGHSMGGVIGTAFCERHPGHVPAFIDVEGNISLEDCTFSATIATHGLDDFIARYFGLFRDDISEKGASYQGKKTCRVTREERRKQP